MFVKRFTVIETQLPTEDELVMWLDDSMQGMGNRLSILRRL